MLKKEEDSLPLLILQRLIHLADLPSQTNSLNWALHFKTWLFTTSAADLWGEPDFRVWEQRGPPLFNELIAIEKRKDIDRYNSSKVLQLKFSRSLEGPPPAYLSSTEHIASKRVLASLRLASTYYWSFCLNGRIFKFSPASFCGNCSLEEYATVEHFIFRCSLQNDPRTKLMDKLQERR